MSDLNSPREQQPTQKRVRTGCLTCRRRRVKCIEIRPVCKACGERGEFCDWGKKPSATENHRGLGPIKSRSPGWKPPVLQSNSVLLSSYEVDRFNERIPNAGLDTFRFSSFHTNNGRNKDADFGSGMLHGPMFISGHMPAIDSLMPPSNQILAPDNDFPYEEVSRFANSQAELHEDLDYMSNSHSNVQNFAVEMPPLPGLLPSFVASPDSMELTEKDYHGLTYFQDKLSRYQTTKDPLWSTSNLFLCNSGTQPLLMHLLLAGSLRSLVNNQEVVDTSETLVRSKDHYQKGVKLLCDEWNNKTEPNHMNVMIAFWFMYLYRSRQADQELNEMMKLSQTVGNYVKKYKLDSLCTGQASSSTSATAIIFSDSDRSLLARLLIWTFYADVSFEFRYRGGGLAKYLSENVESMDRVYKASRPVLELQWGSIYPAEQRDDDRQNLAVLEMLYRSFVVYHAINELCGGLQTWGLVDESIERQLEDIEETYSSTLDQANSITQPRSRLLQNTDWIACIFYAIRIYYFRCTCSDAQSPRPAAVEKALSSLLRIADRTYSGRNSEAYRCPQWALLMAGAETSDSIYSDWILKHMSSTYKRALEKILQAQKTEVRIGASRLREMCDVRDSNEETIGVNIKFGAFIVWS